MADLTPEQRAALAADMAHLMAERIPARTLDLALMRAVGAALKEQTGKPAPRVDIRVSCRFRGR